MNENWIPSTLIKKAERPVIPIAANHTVTRFRRVQIGFNLGRLFLYFIGLALTGRLTAKALGRAIADFCQKTGVLWVKLGQLLSMRSDLFPAELCRELACLQDRVEGFPPEAAITILERELGLPMEQIFHRFDTEPCAAASIAQVHKAFLIKEKIWVAVKIQRPEVGQVFFRDMGMIRLLCKLFDRFQLLRFMRWADMLEEMEQVFQEELDFRYEISNQQRLRRTLAAHPIYVPEVFEAYCSEKVLVMEYIHGVAMSDFLRIWKNDPERIKAWMDKNTIDAYGVGRRLFASYLRQVLEDNLFHADLHPGNIILLQGNRISLLDFGSLGTSEGDLLRKYDIFLQALSRGNYSKAIDVFLLIMPYVPAIHLSSVKDEMRRRLLAWDNRCRVRELPYEEKSTNMVFDEMVKVMGKYGVNINWSFFKLLRGWTTMDTSLRELIPEANLPRLMQVYIRHRENREIKTLLKDLPNDLLKFQNLIDYPRDFAERAIYHGASIRRLAQVSEGATTRVSRLAAMIFQAGSALFFILILGLVSVFLNQHTSMAYFNSENLVSRMAGALPLLDTQVLSLLIILMSNCFITLAVLAGKFRKQNHTGN